MAEQRASVRDEARYVNQQNVWRYVFLTPFGMSHTLAPVPASPTKQAIALWPLQPRDWLLERIEKRGVVQRRR